MKKTNFNRMLALLNIAGWLTMGAAAQTTDDQIIIADATDIYEFVPTSKGLTVKNRQTTTYMLNGVQSANVTAGVYYGENIKLDKASCDYQKPEHRSATPRNVFFDDTKFCYFTNTLTKKGSRQTARFQRTFTDARYCARVSLQDDYYVRHKTVRFIVPTSLKGIRLIDSRLGSHISKTAELVGTDSVFTYTIVDLPRWKDERHSPAYLLASPAVMVAGVFSDYQDLYRWGHELANVDTTIAGIDTLVAGITNGCQTDGERLANTYQWVQRNIRYVAFEAGVEGHRPDRPAEVLRKRYGDCKGMALLLVTLLRHQGFDARLTDVGTSSLPVTISECPSLASVNHVICTVMLHGKSLFMDATCHYLPVGHTPQHIQGRQAMVEDGDSCHLLTIPMLAVETTTDSLSYVYRLDADSRRLQGHAVLSLRGDMKEHFMSTYEQLSLNRKQQMLKSSLNAADQTLEVDSVSWIDDDSRHEWAVIAGHIANSHAVQTIGDETYVELNPHNLPCDGRIDTLKRQNDYEFPMCVNVVRRVSLQLPEGYEVSHLPESFSLTTPQGELSCNFEQQAGSVVYCQRMLIRVQRIPLADIPAWNQSLSQWADACNEQIILKRKAK